MKFAELSIAARTLWAKSSEPYGHGLLAHMLDVAAVAEALLLRESPHTRAWSANAYGLSVDSAPRWLSAWVGLHDFGKAIPGFQCKWTPGQSADQSAGLPFKTIALSVDRHDMAGAALLRGMLCAKFPDAGWIASVVQALGAHHGYMPTTMTLRDAAPRHEGAGWREARQILFDAYWQALCPQGEPDTTEISLPAVTWLAGLTSVADWIGSNQDWFPPGERADSLAGHHREAMRLAEAALEDIGWPGYSTLLEGESETRALMSRMLNKPAIQTRPLQSVSDKLLCHAEGPTFMIVEAPMGEGKTELAFLAHLRLQSANGHRGLYVALPTQATGNAMFERTLAFLNAFSPGTRLDVQLVHGGAILDERIHRLRHIDASETESIASSAWFSQRKRPLLSPYGVGTIDQALFAVLNVKHHFVRLWGLANRVVVLDEVHAYDTYTSGLIEALLRWLKAMNCSVVLMSATLPAKRRAAFLEAWGLGKEPDIPYPRVLMSQGRDVIGAPVGCRPLAPIQVSGIGEDLNGLAEAALDAVFGGGCGAVVVNTVQRAQALFSALENRMPTDTALLLFHARYPANERSEREKAVLAAFGQSATSRRPARALLIATQVVEQSLDIDFDFLLTDLAPVDLLLQRAGRLHRHERQRPSAHRQPRLIVAGFQREREPELQETAWGFVYDPYVLYRTWSIAGKESIWRLPEDIDRLVQAVYASEPLAEAEREQFLKKLDHAFSHHLATQQQHRQLAEDAALSAEAEPQHAYANSMRANEREEGRGLRAATRLGDDSLAIVPVLESEEGWRLLPGDPPFSPAATIDDDTARALFRRQVRINRKDIIRALAEEPTPKSFEEHPLLRNLKPLRLRDSAAMFGNLRVRLDPKLGLIYETMEHP